MLMASVAAAGGATGLGSATGGGGAAPRGNVDGNEVVAMGVPQAWQNFAPERV